MQPPVPPPPPAEVVAVTPAEAAETLPAASYATTVYVYCVEADSPESVYDVPAVVPTYTPPRYTRYPATPAESVDGDQDSDTEELFTPAAG